MTGFESDSGTFTASVMRLMHFERYNIPPKSMTVTKKSSDIKGLIFLLSRTDILPISRMLVKHLLSSLRRQESIHEHTMGSMREKIPAFGGMTDIFSQVKTDSRIYSDHGVREGS